MHASTPSISACLTGSRIIWSCFKGAVLALVARSMNDAAIVITDCMIRMTFLIHIYSYVFSVLPQGKVKNYPKVLVLKGAFQSACQRLRSR
jgi:hypothetical protein